MFSKKELSMFIIYPFEERDCMYKCIKEIKKNFGFINCNFLDRYQSDWYNKVKKMICISDIILIFQHSSGKMTTNMELEFNTAKEEHKPFIEIKEGDREKCTKIIQEHIDRILEDNVINNLSLKLNTPEEREILKSQYEILVNSSESLINRRQTTGDRFTTICCAILAILGSLILVDGFHSSFMLSIVLILSLIGVLLSFTWSNTIKSSGKINRSKYRIIQTLEKQLSARLFYAEWEDMINPFGGGYIPYTKSEKYVPILFSTVFIVIIILYVGCYTFL